MLNLLIEGIMSAPSKEMRKLRKTASEILKSDETQAESSDSSESTSQSSKEEDKEGQSPREYENGVENKKKEKKKKSLLDILPSKPDITCIQEIWLKTGKVFSLKGYECLRQDRMSPIGGEVATLIKDKVPARRLKMTANSAIECLAVEVFLTDSKISICNIYHAEQETDEKFLYDIYIQLPSTAIFCGDFNPHNPLWGGKNGQERESPGRFHRHPSCTERRKGNLSKSERRDVTD